MEGKLVRNEAGKEARVRAVTYTPTGWTLLVELSIFSKKIGVLALCRC